MDTLALLAQKGGTGKTTLAINLSVSAEAAGWRVADIALVPLRPGVRDLRALGSTAHICALAGARTAVVLN